MIYADTYINLNIDLADTDNFTFTQEEKERALDAAWNDPYNTSLVWDETTTYDNTVYTYAVPAGIDYIKGYFYKQTSSDFPVPIDSNAFERAGDTLYLNNDFRFLIPHGSTLVFKGAKQLTTADSLADDRVEYVLKLARYNTLSLLGGKKANRFLQNDTSMADIMAMRQTLERDIASMRRRFAQATERV
jgi:hypothetical protein